MMLWEPSVLHRVVCSDLSSNEQLQGPFPSFITAMTMLIQLYASLLAVPVASHTQCTPWNHAHDCEQGRGWICGHGVVSGPPIAGRWGALA